MRMPRFRPTLAGTDAAAVTAIGVIAVATTAGALVQSYRGLLDWALHYARIPAQFAWFWPGMVDSFLVIGELILLVAAIRGLSGWAHAWGWALTMTGLAASLAGNIGHVGWSAGLAVKLSAAVPPLAAAAALGTGLGLVRMAARKTDRKTPGESNGHPPGKTNGKQNGKIAGTRPAHLIIVRDMVDRAGPGNVSIEQVRKTLGKRHGYARDLLHEVDPAAIR